ncbi:hypothetical protein BGZ63DRAFT_419407 [Mariannaea sp. PMI_226]|nr:hypothetical protein BGZ63DRAFT_419407 [Mariannaea sp. PMI_226]
MADSTDTQALIAAFTFGTVVNAATGGVFLYLKGYASSLWRDGLRLVLVTFLSTSALWAQIDFITTLISVDSSTGCQVAIVFASAFDQLARVSIQQAIIWSLNYHDRVSPTESLIAQGAVPLRFALGIAFVSLQRPQLDNVCVTSTSSLPYGFILLAADFTFTIVILARAISVGLMKDVRHGASGSNRSKAALLMIVAFGIWTGTSVPLMLGIRSVSYIARTAVPAGGISILIAVLVLFKDNLGFPKAQHPNPFEDAHPQNDQFARNLENRNVPTDETMSFALQPQEMKDPALESFEKASQFNTMALRTVPGVPKSTLPVIARPVAGQAVTGIGGIPVQGQLFPPMMALTMPGALESQERRLALPRKKSTKLVISNPIMSQDNEGKVLAKIPTIDLNTAVLQERQRMASNRIIAPPIQVAALTQPRPPPPIPPKALDRVSRSFGDDAVSNVSTIMDKAGVALGAPSRELSTASTSSAMLSPAPEELRRRSPRQPPPISPGQKAASPSVLRHGPQPRQEEPLTTSPKGSLLASNLKPLLKDPQHSVVNFSIPIDARNPVLPFRHQIHKPEIRPSRRGNLSSPNNNTVESQSQTNSLQQKRFPTKPIKRLTPDAAKDNTSKSNDSGMAPSPRVVSVVHRPRPIPRWAEIDRAIFPAEGSPNMHEHKRSLSHGASRNKRSMVFADAANGIPPFPPLPKSAGTFMSGSHSGDTRSMTWDEKMEKFYPESSNVHSSNTSNLKRRSRSVPDLPVLSILSDEKRGSASSHSLSHHAADSTRASTTTQGISNLLEEFPQPQGNKAIDSFLKDDTAVHRSTSQDMEMHLRSSLKHRSKPQGIPDRRSSPVLPPEDLSILTPLSEAKSRDEEVSTSWGSIHSPVTFVNVQIARAIEVPTVPKVPTLPQSVQTTEAAETSSPRGSEKNTTASVRPDETPTEKGGVGSAYAISHTIGQKQKVPEQRWHRRVGEKCPTFSERGGPAVLRKAPPPAPLLLSRMKMEPMASLAQPSNPSSPNHALAAIQHQLRNLEEPGSKERHSMTLLAKLEAELGQQEYEWHGLRDTLMVRDSQSTLRTVTPNPDLAIDGRNDTVATLLEGGSVLTNQASRPVAPQQVNYGPAHSPSFQASDSTQTGIAQQQLAENQVEERGIRPSVSTEADVKDNSQSSGLSMYTHLLRTEHTDGFESEYDQPRNRETDPAKALLWRPTSSPDVTVLPTVHTLLWTPVSPVAKAATLNEDSHQSRTVVTQHRGRRDFEPLSIESSHLWEKVVSLREESSHHGLWRAQSPPVSKSETEVELKVTTREQPVKPVTARRPPRRIKRITLLPDILESPKPIADRRGTLGIFQFPWGEMSDIASLPARPSTMMVMPSRMANIHDEFGTDATSFFEDYEAEEEGDSDYNTFSDSGEEEDDDDGFDENVLWEIASLLTPRQERHSDNVFSAESVTHQGGQENAARYPLGEASNPSKFGERESSEALGFLSTNFASSQTEQIAMQELPSPRAAVRTATTALATSREAPTREPNAPKGDGPHATAKPMGMDQDPSRRLVQGFFLGEEKRAVRAPGGSTDEANLSSATDAAARTLSPKAEHVSVSCDKVGHGGDGFEFISNNHMPETEPGSLPPLCSCQSPAGAPMTTVSSVHETGSTHALHIPAPPTNFSSTGTDPEEPPTGVWTLNSVHTATPPRQVPVLSVTSRVMLPSADISAGSSATTQDDFIIIQSVTPSSASSSSLDSSCPSSEKSLHQLSPQLTVPKHETLLRNAYELSPLVGPMAMLWSPPSAPILRPSKGLYQPDAQTWSSYLPTESAARAVPRKAELVTLESSTLWAPTPVKKLEEPSHDGLWSIKKSQEAPEAPAPAMWVKPDVFEPVSYGLAQPAAELWSTYLIAEDETPRVKQRETEPAVIKSQSLWTKPAPAPVLKHEGPLWNSAKVAPTAAGFGLWAPPADATEVDEEPVGLFSLSHRRSDFRTSSLSPAALHMERKKRSPLQPFPDFVFAHLWNQAPLWDADANYAKIKEQEEIDALVLEGLFSLNHRRTNYRTTSEPPAALVTKTKPRISQHTLPKLTSDSLWSVQSQAPAPVQRDWLAATSGKSWRTLSVVSTSSEAESTKSVSTIASSVSSDYGNEKPIRRLDATPAQWLEALREAVAAGQGALSKDQTLDSSESLSSAYQLWSRRIDTNAAQTDSTSMWKPMASPTNNYLVLTAVPGALDDAQLHASSASLRRNSKSSASRPPPPVFHGCTHSAFLPAVNETPRDFGDQALWSAEGDALEALEDERAWLDKSLRNGMAVAQLG